MIYNPKQTHTCPCCGENKAKTREHWMQADTQQTMHQRACKTCLAQREADMKAAPPNLRSIMKNMKFLEKRIGRMTHA